MVRGASVEKSPKRLQSPSGNSLAAPAATSESPPEKDLTATLTLRLRRSSVEAIASLAREQGLTMKQVVCKALIAAGVSVAKVDLENHTPRRAPL
jgi:hypothetical protein